MEEDRGILVRFVEETTKSSKTPDKTEIHQASCSMGNGDTIHDGKAPEHEAGLHLVPKLITSGAITIPLHTPS